MPGTSRATLSWWVQSTLMHWITEQGFGVESSTNLVAWLHLTLWHSASFAMLRIILQGANDDCDRSPWPEASGAILRSSSFLFRRRGMCHCWQRRASSSLFFLLTSLTSSFIQRTASNLTHVSLIHHAGCATVFIFSFALQLSGSPTYHLSAILKRVAHTPKVRTGLAHTLTIKPELAKLY